MEPAASSLSPSLAARIGPDNIRSLILEKEKELHDINEYRIHTLETLLREKETAATAAKQKLSKLQEDFTYNLKLLEGRDDELALYDANFASLKSVLRDREVEISEYRAREAELRTELERANEQRKELELECHEKVKTARAQVEGARWKFDDELRRLEESVETQKRRIERQLRDKDDEIERQRRELTRTFDDAFKKRESEYKRLSDEWQTKVDELMRQKKELEEEKDGACHQVEECKTRSETLEQLLEEKEKAMKTLEWQVADVKMSKATKVRELELEVKKWRVIKDQLMTEYENKMADLVQSLHAVERAFGQQKTEYEATLEQWREETQREMEHVTASKDSQIEKLRITLREQENEMEKSQADWKQMQWENEKKVSDKERELERMRQTVEELNETQRRVVTELEHELVMTKRTMEQRLDELEEESRNTVAEWKEKEKNQRLQLVESRKNEEKMQRDVADLTMRWEQRWHAHEREVTDRYEARLGDLQQVNERLEREKQAAETAARNDVVRLQAELVALEKARVEVASSPLWSDDPGTLSPLSLHEPPSPLPQPVNTALEKENRKLRDVIREMKEALTHEALQNESPRALQLAAELAQAQERGRALERQLEEKVSECESETLRKAEVTELEGQVTELRGKLERARWDMDRLVQERRQLMDLSNQLRAELRRNGTGLAGAWMPPVEFTGKKDYEQLIAKLTQSLEDARRQIKSLKKELRRMVKSQLQREESLTTSVSVPKSGELDEQLLALARRKSGKEASVHEEDRDEEADDSSATIGGNSSAKVADARVKLQQAKEKLFLTGKKATVAGTSASSIDSTRQSERETASQRLAVKKLKQVQGKRTKSIATERNTGSVRNYNDR